LPVTRVGVGQYTLDGKIIESADPLPRPRNDIWDALEEILNYTPITKNELSEFGQVVRSFTHAGVTPAQMKESAKEYRRRWPDVDLTMHALERWFSHMLAQTKPKRKVAVCPECGVAEGAGHAADCSKVSRPPEPTLRRVVPRVPKGSGSGFVAPALRR